MKSAVSGVALRADWDCERYALKGGGVEKQQPTAKEGKEEEVSVSGEWLVIRTMWFVGE